MSTIKPQAATLSSPAASATTAVLLAAGSSRNGFSIFNEGSTILYVAFAATASVTAYTVQVPVNGSVTYDPATYAGVVSGIWAGSPTGNGRVTVW